MALSDATDGRSLSARLGFGDRPAVLVVDFIRAFTDPASPFGAPLDRELQRTRQLLDRARAARTPVLFTSVAYEQPDAADAGLWARKVPASVHLRAGTPAVELDERLAREPAEPVVVKKYASAFFGTDLASRLTTAGVDTLLVAGCTTSGCVRATAVDGLQHGFRVIVVRECVGDRDGAAHAQSLADLDRKYADVVALDEALEQLKAAVR